METKSNISPTPHTTGNFVFYEITTVGEISLLVNEEKNE